MRARSTFIFNLISSKSGILIFCSESLKRYNSLPFRHWVKVYLAKYGVGMF